MAINSTHLVTTRLTAQVQPASANSVVGPDSRTQTLPGQGGVVTGIKLGEIARARVGDHVEPGVSLGHPDADAYHAIRLLACVGNSVRVLDGPAAGAQGIVFGKHGAVLAMFSQEALAMIMPGQRVAIDAVGVGLAGPPEVSLHSCSPQLYDALVELSGNRKPRVKVTKILPSIAAAAGIGMPAEAFNMDLHTSSEPIAEMAKSICFGDIVAVRDQDHRFGRQHRPGWVMVGIISHGTTVGGGHGLGLMTLMTAPETALDLEICDDARLGALLDLAWGDE